MNLCEMPFLLEPTPVDYLLPGGTMINDFLGRDTKAAVQPSQLWVASVVQSLLLGARDSRSRIAPPHQNICLAELISQAPQEYLGEAHAKTFGANPGMLLKLLNTSQRLLVQTHPTKALAQKYFKASFGKTEAWHVLRALPGACLYLGFKPGVTKNAFKKLIKEQNTIEILNCLHEFEAKEGDTVYIPAGFAHALGANCLVAEIQEPTDITLRAERIRPDGTEMPEESLHSGIGMEALLECFNFETGTKEEVARKFFVKPVPINKKETNLLPSAALPFFGMHAVMCAKSYEKTNKAFCVGIVLEGEGSLQTKDCEISLKRGSEFFIPAGVAEYKYTARRPMRLLECYPPKVYDN